MQLAYRNKMRETGPDLQLYMYTENCDLSKAVAGSSTRKKKLKFTSIVNEDHSPQHSVHFLRSMHRREVQNSPLQSCKL